MCSSDLVCDIRGVGPGTWNNWKAMLLRQLYRDTADALEGGLETANRENRAAEAKRALREALSDWDARAPCAKKRRGIMRPIGRAFRQQRRPYLPSC